MCVYLAESTEEMLAVSRFVDSNEATADGNKNMHVYEQGEFRVEQRGFVCYYYL